MLESLNYAYGNIEWKAILFFKEWLPGTYERGLAYLMSNTTSITNISHQDVLYTI